LVRNNDTQEIPLGVEVGSSNAQFTTDSGTPK